jgi:hypothetical protein
MASLSSAPAVEAAAPAPACERRRVKVAVRCRPFLDYEEDEEFDKPLNQVKVLRHKSPRDGKEARPGRVRLLGTIGAGNQREFQFDYAFTQKVGRVM